MSRTIQHNACVENVDGRKFDCVETERRIFNINSCERLQIMKERNKKIVCIYF
jgi:hypothetical protein